MKIANTFQHILGGPSPHLEEHEGRRSKLLSILLLSLILLIAAAFVAAFFINPSESPFSSGATPIAVIALFALASAFLLNKAGNYFFASRLTVVCSAVGAWASVFLAEQNGGVDPFIIPFALISVLLSSILLRTFETVLIGIFHLAVMLIYFPNLTNGIIFMGFMWIVIVVASFVTRSDFNQIRRQNEKIEKNEKRFRALVENSNDAIILINRYGETLYQSPAAQKILDYPIEELINKSVFDFVHPEDFEEVKQEFNRLIDNPLLQTRIRFRALRKNGEVVWIEALGQNKLDDPDIGALVGNYRDITEQKHAQALIDRQIKQLNILRDIDNVITSSFDLNSNLGVILSSMNSHLGIDASDVLAFDPSQQELKYIYGRGFRTSRPEGRTIPLGEGVTGLAALQRKIEHVSDLKKQNGDELGNDSISGEDFVSYVCVPLMAKGVLKGVLELFNRTYLNPNPEWMEFLNVLAGQTSIALDNAQLFEGLQQSNLELSLAYDATIEGWSRALDLRDRETEGHTQRVTKLTLELAEAFGMKESELGSIRRGALLHDIGKMGIPDAILYKQGTLTQEEWETMKKHPQMAYDLLKPVLYLRPSLDIPYSHHEHWDGSGYPRGLKGNQIPLAARIFAIADVYDALCSDRPYRKAWPKEEVIGYVREESGRLFDPRVVDTFLRLYGESVSGEKEKVIKSQGVD